MANYVVKSGTLFEDFETVGDWTAAGSGGGSIAADTTHVQTGSSSLQVNGDDGNESATKTISIVGTNLGVFGLWVYLPDITNLFGVTIYLSSSATFTSTFSFQWLKTRLRNGWNFLTVDRNSWTNTGGEAWTNTLIRMRVRVDTNAGQPASASFDSLYYGIYARPKIVVIFDDGRSSAYSEGYAYMKLRQLKGTVGVNSENVGTAGWATLAQLQEMYAGGWDMANHSAEHPHMTGLSSAAQLAQITDVTTWLEENGFDLGRGGRHFIYPYGEYDNTVIANVSTAEMLTGRSIITQNQATVKGIDNPSLLFAKELAQSINLTTAKGYIDNAIASGTTLFLFAHLLVASPAASTEWPIADFQSLIDYIQRYRDGNVLDVVTVGEWYRGLTSPRKVV